MSKGLESLKQLKMWATNGYTACKEKECEKIAAPIEKELKALEIMKKYKHFQSFFAFNPTYKVYQVNMSFYEDEELMSEEDYDLLKEVLL